ncbi:hypothetical protein M409DRAFT_70050 [Zasmidium cellare ATCC 36951]|uniref:Altered inheritance of mitochondria protein 6 n=1 Tax=Zasmidium cellare ATCC 36951 TaxID=1080233 RepID=A0A6A6C1N7_ZASCE|nr:uncharacterized protein M409DRAFT_70050 [Zasmidium cellare ATCC 36951]KAF2160967.1 hypothetical protein M409DRAFT_70050 [Zasmidium cellare ATCC 36951]
MASPTTAGASGTKSASANTFALDSRSESSTSSAAAGPYRDSFDDDEESQDNNQYVADRPRRGGVLSRILQAVGMRRRTTHAPPEYNDYFSTPRDQLPDGLLRHPKPVKHSRHSSPRELRRCRRGHVGAVVKRIVLLSPVAILAFFGIIHILHALIGRAGFFWDSSVEDEFLPDWGKPGNVGEGLAEYPTDATRDVIPIACHSHNDYWRRIPFYDAIHWGCTGVEADVWLFDEELYVGHNTASLTKNRTFRNLYVNPILEMLAKMNPETDFANASNNTHGVFDADPDQSLILLVDFKTSGKATYEYVHNQLSALREKDYLTYHDGTTLHQRPVTVVGTGNCPFDLITASATHRDIFFDAPLSQMGTQSSSSTSKTTRNQHSSSQGSSGTTPSSSFDSTNSYYASVSFTSSIGFVWRRQLSKKQLATIRSQIKGAHDKGLKVRYWDTPSWPRDLRNHVWRVLMREGADMLNVDDLKGAAVESWRARVHGFW